MLSKAAMIGVSVAGGSVIAGRPGGPTDVSQGWSERSEHNPWDLRPLFTSPGGAADYASVAPPGLVPFSHRYQGFRCSLRSHLHPWLTSVAAPRLPAVLARARLRLAANELVVKEEFGRVQQHPEH